MLRATRLLARVCAVAAAALFVALPAGLVPAWLDYQAFAAELLCAAVGLVVSAVSVWQGSRSSLVSLAICLCVLLLVFVI
jgi:hypothetical protein